MPAADFCRTIRMNCSILSPDSGTCGRPPAIRLTAFDAQPPDLQPAPLMDMDFAVTCQLVPRRMPHVRFLSIGSRLCSTLPSGPASRRRPCASLSLLLHQDLKGTSTPQLSFMLGTHRKRRSRWPRLVFSEEAFFRERSCFAEIRNCCALCRAYRPVVPWLRLATEGSRLCEPARYAATHPWG